jgi:hypothetical protein
MVRAPSGRAWIQIGSEWKEDPYRFAVYLPEVEASSTGALSTKLLPRLGVTADGEIQMRGDTTLEGDLTVEGGSIEFGVGPVLAKPRPWRIYHVYGREDPSDQASSNVHQLRIEMDTPASGNPAGNNQVSIGVWSAKQNRFMPCLTVNDMCVVTVHGNLHVEGTLEAPNMSGGAAISKEARASKAGMVMLSLSQGLGTQGTRSNLERQIRSAAAEIAPIASRTSAAVENTNLQPRLDDAMKEVIQVLRDNSLLPRFMTLLGEESSSGERMEETVIPDVTAEAPTISPEPAEPQDQPPMEEEKPKPRTRSRKKSE